MYLILCFCCSAEWVSTGLIQLCPLLCIARLLWFVCVFSGLHQSPYLFWDPLCWLFMYTLHDKLKGKADLYKFTCPSECHIHTRTWDLQSSSTWQCVAEAAVSGKGAPPTPWALSIPSHTICALLLCVLHMESGVLDNRLFGHPALWELACFQPEQGILRRTVTAWVEHQQLNASFKYLGGSWNKV